MDVKRFLRYLAPNLVTSLSLVFGMASIKASVDGHFALAGWFVMFSVITDKVDGFVARAVRGTSEFGVQMDSFADFLSFGIAPAVMFSTYLSQVPELPFATGSGRLLLLAVCTLWVLAVTFRLARYNIVNDDPKCRHIFFGVPTTFAAAWVVSGFLAMVKYGAPAYSELGRYPAGEFRLLGDLVTPRGMWLALPGVLVVGAVLMASTVRVPKMGRRRSKLLTAFILAGVLAGYVFGALRMMPEVLAAVTSSFMVLVLGYSALAADARGLKAPPIFPKSDPPRGQEPQRPEEDLVDDEDESADESADDSAATPPTHSAG